MAPLPEDSLNQPSEVYVASGYKRKKLWLILILLILLLIVVILAAFFLKSSLYINLLTKPENISISSKPEAKLSLKCPVPKEFCSKVTTLELLSRGNKKYDGLGWNLPKDTVLQAAFNGNYKEQDIAGATPSARIIFLTSDSGRYEARYIFASTQKLSVAEQQKFAEGISIKANGALAAVTDIPLTSTGHEEANIQFYIIDKQNNGKTIQLQPQDLGKLTLP